MPVITGGLRVQLVPYLWENRKVLSLGRDSAAFTFLGTKGWVCGFARLREDRGWG